MLAWAFDAAYVIFLIAVSPWLFYRRFIQKKNLAGLGVKLTGNIRRQDRDRPCLWFHAVSVGEVLQLQALLARVQERYPDYEIVVTTTTGTGFEVAKTKYPNFTVRYFPLDFSWAVRRAMKNLRPKLIVLVELELWPNFLAIAHEREIPVAIINGRISDKSFRTYRRVAWLTRPLLDLCSLIAVQNQPSGERFLQLGAPPSRVIPTGNIKFDGNETNRDNPKTVALRQCFGIQPDELVFVAGSTQDPEEELAIRTWEELRPRFPKLRLLLVPRHKERFEEVAGLVASRGHRILRRSASDIEKERRGEGAKGKKKEDTKIHTSHRFEPSPPHTRVTLPTFNTQPILLLDTLGELRHAWGLADIAFVGGSLTNRGGQNMIEPAGYGAAVHFGPNTWNFRDVSEALLSQNAAVVIHDGEELTTMVRRLITNVAARRQMGELARRFVVSQQGATHRTLDLLSRIVGVTPSTETCSAKAA